MSKLITYTDGGSRGNPGPSACGVVIKNDKNEIILKTSKYIGETTNNQAEYEALVLALQKAKGIFKSWKIKKGSLECYLDSELVVKHLNHEYKIKDEGLQPLFIKVWNLMLDFNSVKFIHIPREKNKLADELVNVELDAREKNKGLF
jgi:ribonuclease HI